MSNASSAQSLAGSSLWAGTAESWLEGAVRRNITILDPLVREHPIHRQVITFAGTDRNAVDLLGIRHDGQLVVLELKGSEDIHLPLQALDYWIRVNWHAQARELTHLFPGQSIKDVPARLLLVAPALSFHSTHECILRYFSEVVDVERIGVGVPWAERLTVLTRLRKADLPQSQNEHRGFSPHQKGFVEPEP